MPSLSASLGAIGTAAILPLFSAALFGAPDEFNRVNDAGSRTRLNCGATIECITPHTKNGVDLRESRQIARPALLIMDDDTISCPLTEGDTTFIVALPSHGTLDRLKFVNDNAGARGALRIAVANEELPAQSTRWTPVDGAIAFHQKRLFNLSLLGVEAKFVRVTFSVEAEANFAAVDLAVMRSRSDKPELCRINDDELCERPIYLSGNLPISSAAPLIAALHP